jgi:hypothetical protein
MSPINPAQILRNLESGYFMTHYEQEEAAVYIRSLQEKIRGALIALQTGSELDVKAAIQILRDAK